MAENLNKSGNARQKKISINILLAMWFLIVFGAYLFNFAGTVIDLPFADSVISFLNTVFSAETSI